MKSHVVSMQLTKKIALLIGALLISPSLHAANSVEIAKSGNLTVYQQGSAPQRALLVFPGAYIDSNRYAHLVSEIIEQSHGEIMVMVSDFFRSVANPVEAPSRVDQALAVMSERHITGGASVLFLAGHSEGGTMGHGVVESKKLAGMVLLGSYLNHTLLIGSSISQYSRPVLTLGAEFDGLTGINYLAREAHELQTISNNDSSLLAVKPVIILRGQDHMQFADGQKLEGDLPAEVDLSIAHERIAQVVVNFIEANSPVLSASSEASRQEARRELTAQTLETRQFLMPLVSSFDHMDAVCARMQFKASPLASNSWTHIDIATRYYEHQNAIGSFIFDKSSVNAIPSSPGRYRVEIPVYAEYPLHPIDISLDQFVSPEVLACKLRSQASIVKETAYPAAPEPALSCAEMNIQVFREALNLLTDPAQRQRFDSKWGDPNQWSKSLESATKSGDETWSWGPLTVHSTRQQSGQAWIAGKFGFAKNKDTPNHWNLETSELLSGTDSWIPSFAGAHYCKIIPPLRVLEWATLFAFKP